MNVYDTVNKLAGELRESEAFLEFKKVKEMLKTMPELENKMKDFDVLRYETQILSMQQGKAPEDKYKKMQDTYMELVSDENAKKYLEAETKFNTLISDVNRIIGESIKDVLK